jgi:hypothetical protein
MSQRVIPKNEFSLKGTETSKHAAENRINVRNGERPKDKYCSQILQDEVHWRNLVSTELYVSRLQFVSSLQLSDQISKYSVFKTDKFLNIFAKCIS